MTSMFVGKLVTLTLGVILVTSVVSAAGPRGGTVQGTVISASDRQPIVGARVSAGVLQTLSADGGRFELVLPLGHAVLSVSAPGFATTTVEIEVRDGELAQVEFVLVTASFREELEVVAHTTGPAPAPAVTAVRPREVETVAGGAENVFRVLQTLPGVAPTDDFTSRLAVRGGGPDQNLTVMDGIEIHNPYRLFGLVAAFNPETVEQFELTAGAFSARHGDRLSSLLTVQNRDGSRSAALAGAGALSVTDTNLVLEGRLPQQRGSWLVSARRTYYDLVAERFTDGDLPSFTDLQPRLAIDLGRGRSLSFQFLISRETTDATFTDPEADAEGAVDTHSNNDLGALTLHHPLGARAWSRSIASAYKNTEIVDFAARFEDEGRRSNAPDDSGFARADVDFAGDTSVRDWALRQEFGWQLAARHALDFGFELHRLHTRIACEITGDRNPNEANGSSVNIGASLPDLFDTARSDTRTGAWIEDAWQATPRLQLRAGLRFDRSTINARNYWLPRLSATWKLGDRTRVRGALGVHRQSPGYEKLVQSDYFSELAPSGVLALDSERARHALASLERDLPGGMLMRVEGYYKGFDRLLVGRLETPSEIAARLANYDFPPDLAWSLPTEARITTDPNNGSDGRGYGADIYLARPATLANRLAGWASYTYGFANRNAYGRNTPFDYDRRHALSIVASYKLTRRLELAATARVASGFPYTPVLDLRVDATEDAADADGDGNATELIPARDPQGLLIYATNRGGVPNLNSARLPYYARLDLRLTYTPKRWHGRMRFYVDVINALNRKNAGVLNSRLEYDPNGDRPRLVNEPGESIPFLPSFGIHFYFGRARARP